MKNIASLFLIFCVICLSALASPLKAAEKKFIVMPFAINAPQNFAYLSKAVPATIQNRLSKPGALSGKTASGGTSPADAKTALAKNKADYAVYGSINVLGNDCTVETFCVDKNGKIWSKSASAPVSNLTSTINGLTSAMGAEAMGEAVMARPGLMAASPQKGKGAGNADIIVNETGQNQVYLNPQFRYQGAGASDGSRIRSQRLKGNMVDMALGDFNGDGKTEIAIIGDHKLSIYIWEPGGKLKQLGETEVSRSNNNFSMRAMDLDRNGVSDLVVCTFEEESNRPYTFFFTFQGNKFSQLSPRIPYFASVMKLPPTFAPTLVGQAWDSLKLFAPGIHQMTKTGGKYALGARVNMPAGANVFNCAWIPDGKNQGGDILVMLTDDEKLKVFQGSLDKPIHTTMEHFSGSATGMEFYKSMPGLSMDKTSQLASKYFSPMRMIATDIGATGENVLLLNKPISTASQFFDRYRFFPQGEIHALYWDGVGLGLKWKTRRIRGSVAEIDLGDVNNDGILDLVVGLNTSPELGIGSRQSMITAYPLDITRTDPNTPADMSDFEYTPEESR